jgi:dephospho-CoA kinase
MLVVGVTGGIGSGKSTVAGLLAARGARVLDADAIVRDLYGGGELPRRIEERFGPGVTDASGAVDRPALARVVFADPGARKDLEELVHPAVRRTVLDRLDGWRREGFDGLAVIDAALLVETDAPYPLDALVVVTAPELDRIARLEARGVPADEARRRMAAQAGDEEKEARADHVVANDGSLEDLRAAVDRLLRDLGRPAPDPD